MLLARLASSAAALARARASAFSLSDSIIRLTALLRNSNSITPFVRRGLPQANGVDDQFQRSPDLAEKKDAQNDQGRHQAQAGGEQNDLDLTPEAVVVGQVLEQDHAPVPGFERDFERAELFGPDADQFEGLVLIEEGQDVFQVVGHEHGAQSPVVVQPVNRAGQMVLP